MGGINVAYFIFGLELRNEIIAIIHSAFRIEFQGLGLGKSAARGNQFTSPFIYLLPTTKVRPWFPQQQHFPRQLRT